MREKNGMEQEEERAPCCVKVPPRKMAPEKMRIYGTPEVIEKACFISPYRGEQVQIQDNMVTVILPGIHRKNNKATEASCLIW